MTKEIINPLVLQYHQYIKFYMFDCRDKGVIQSGRFTMCGNPDQTPFF